MQGTFLDFEKKKGPVRKLREGQRDPKRDKTRKRDFTNDRNRKRGEFETW